MSTTPSITTGGAQERNKKGFGIYAAFVPWLLFTLITQHDSLKAAAIAALDVLALIAFSSLLLTPFTEQYARESAPRELWSSTGLKEINRMLTLMWSWVFVAMIPSHLIAGAIDTRRANTIFNCVVPIVLIVWAAKQTAAGSTTEHALAR